MKKNIRYYIVLPFFIFAVHVGFSQVFYTESFETNGVGYSFTANSGMDAQDFFERTDLAGAPAQEVFTYSGFDGSFFIAGEDIDGIAGGTGSDVGEVLISGINITGRSNLEFTAAFASGTNIDIDTANDAMWVEVQIDSGGWVEIGRFEGDPSTMTSGGTTNGQFAQDTTGDGNGDGALLNGTFQDFTFPISGTGNSLDVRISMDLNAGDEEAAFDNVRIGEGTAATTEVSFALASNTIGEDGSSIDVCVSIANEDATNATTVELALDGGSTTTNGDDYSSITFPHTLTFPAGSTTDQCLTINITDDMDVEGSETIVLNLQNPMGGNSAALGSTTQHTITLTDNDTPGMSPGDIIVTEIMQNPAAVSDSLGEWFEVYNTTGSAIDMNGWVISDDGSDSHTIGSSVVVSANSYAVFARNGDSGTNGGVTVDYVYGTSISLSNSDDEVILTNSGTEIDAVRYDNGATFPDPTGASMTLRSNKFDVSDNDIGYSWCDGVTAYGDGDLGTPGAANDDCKCDNLEPITWSAGAWSNGTGPTVENNAVIDDAYNTNTNGDIATTCNCTINSGITLTIPAGSYLRTEGDIINNGTVVVEHEGSIVQVDDDATVTGTDFQIQKTTTTYVEYDYTYWSSPVQGAMLGTVFSASPQDQIYAFTTANFDDSSPANSFDDDNDDWSVATGAMTEAEGYAVMGEGADFPFDETNMATNLTQSVSFDGTINNGVITIPVTLDANPGDLFNNDNLIGNPYPSAINAQLFLDGNPNLSGTLYFWTHHTPIAAGTAGTDTDAFNFTNDDYATYVSGSGYAASASGATVPTDDLIASGQGFFASVTTAGNVTFNNSMRVNTGNDNFFRIPEEKDRIWLNFTDEDELFRQILIAFDDNATVGHDRDYDGMRMFNGDNYDFYSILSGSSSRYAIQGLPLVVNERIVPLGIAAKESGQFQISIDRFEGDLANINVYLRDNLFNTLNDLKVSNYNLAIDQTGEVNDRFELVFSRNVLSENEVVATPSDLIVSNLNDAIHLEMTNGNIIKSIEAYNIVGKRVLNQVINSDSYDIQTNIDNGTVLFIKAQLENGQTLVKKFIKL